MQRHSNNHFSGGLRQQGVIKKDLPDQPLVSIVTIVRNDEEGIRKTIESVLSQEYGPLEYIIIDGGSTDNTVDVIRQFEEKIDYWESEPDTGISDAFNKGIRAAQGKYIGLINAGDWYESKTVLEVIEAFREAPKAGVICGALQFWDGAVREYICQSEPQLLEKDMTVTHPTCFVRADLYERFGMYEDSYRFAMDYRLLLSLKMHGVEFVALPSVLANMQHSGTSEANWQEALKETHRARKELLPGSFFASKTYYEFVELKRRIRLLLQKLGWEKVIALYRRRLALVKKSKV